MGVTDEVEDPASVGLDPVRIDRARRMITEQVESGRSPGIAALVTRHGKVVLAEAVGVRSPQGDQMQIDTVFGIASATKPITAGVVMSLVEDGEIGLMQRVVDYLPEFPEGLEGVLVHHLLTHTGGFETPEWTGRFRTRMLEHGEEDQRWGRDAMVNAFLGCVPDLAIRVPPGRGMLYSTFNYELLGEIVRRVSGRSLGDLMRERIFAPLGMHDTAMIPGPGLRERLVDYSWPLLPLEGVARATFGHGWDVMLDADSGGGGLVSTVGDNVTYSHLILGAGTLNGERVLSRRSVEAMTTNQIPGVPDNMFGNKEASWGYGFSVICEERWPYFGGGLIPPGSVTHAGAGGIDHWIDFEHGIAGAYFELITEISPMMEPVSAAGHRFQDVITAAVID